MHTDSAPGARRLGFPQRMPATINHPWRWCSARRTPNLAMRHTGGPVRPAGTDPWSASRRSNRFNRWSDHLAQLALVGFAGDFGVAIGVEGDAGAQDHEPAPGKKSSGGAVDPVSAASSAFSAYINTQSNRCMRQRPSHRRYILATPADTSSWRYARRDRLVGLGDFARRGARHTCREQVKNSATRVRLRQIKQWCPHFTAAVFHHYCSWLTGYFATPVRRRLGCAPPGTVGRRYSCTRRRPGRIRILARLHFLPAGVVPWGAAQVAANHQ